MNAIEELYEAIGKMSNLLVEQGERWYRELNKAKNYFGTPDLKQWSYGKSIIENRGGSDAKEQLVALGFINVLDSTDYYLKDHVTETFLEWAAKVQGFDIIKKFEADRESGHPFELFLHKSILENNTLRLKQDTQQEFDEGFRKEITIEAAKRDRKLIRDAKDKYGAVCAVCGFDFEEKYGEHGKDFIEIHHLYPLAGGQRKTTLDDVRPVCSNCHRMLHYGKKLLSIEELKAIIKKAKEKR